MTEETVSTADVELRTEIEIDPVCGASLSADSCRDDLIVEFADRLYLFCDRGCLDRFLHEPERYAVAGRAEP